MNFSKFLFLCFVLTTCTAATATDNDSKYFCVAEAATGFLFKDNKWITTNFTVSDSKYIIRKLENDELTNDIIELSTATHHFTENETIFGVFKMGTAQSTPEFLCRFTAHLKVYRCNERSSLGEFLFSAKSGRFLKTYTGGYWSNIPYYVFPYSLIERGVCSKI